MLNKLILLEIIFSCKKLREINIRTTWICTIINQLLLVKIFCKEIHADLSRSNIFSPLAFGGFEIFFQTKIGTDRSNSLEIALELGKKKMLPICQKKPLIMYSK